VKASLSSETPKNVILLVGDGLGISQGPSEAIDVPGESLPTVLELAQKAGKRTGDVSTAEITDATPAVLAAHISQRACQGPEDTAERCPSEAAGGPGSIAEEEVDHRIDVILGGGRARFEQATDAGRASSSRRRGRLRDRRRRRGPRGGRRVGSAARALRRRQHDDGVDRPAGDARRRHPGAALRGGQPPGGRAEPRRDDAQGDRAAGRLREGFFLQVEGASIDKQDHAANACAQIGETIAFDDAVGVALDYQATHPDTLVVVTADHSHTSQIVAEDTEGEEDPPGYSNNLVTADGQTMRVTYGTAGGHPTAETPPSQGHTGAAVPVFAAGPQAAAVLGTHDHTDLFPLLQGEPR